LRTYVRGPLAPSFVERLMPNESRAVARYIEPGTEAICPGCDKQVKFQARAKSSAQRVICNVYEDGVWDRVEQWHLGCYDGRYGEPVPARPKVPA